MVVVVEEKVKERREEEEKDLYNSNLLYDLNFQACEEDLVAAKVDN